MTGLVVPSMLANRYVVQSQIGEGGAALVFRVEDRKLGVVRAVKCLHPKWCGEDKARKRFQNEARLMAQLKDPHIVPVHDVGTEGNIPFMVMDWLEGGSVGQVLQSNGPFSPREAVQVLRAVLKGLHTAHQHGVVHRDVKPHNVLLDRIGVPKLTDFGVAHIEDATHGLTETGHAVGTMSYMAPEQHMQARDVDHRADVYACGSMLFAMVSGRRPYALHQDALDSERFSSLPPFLCPIVFKATRFQRAERYESAEEMLQALEIAADMVGQRIQLDGIVRGVVESSVRLGEPTMDGTPPEKVMPVDDAAQQKRTWAIPLGIGVGLLALVLGLGIWNELDSSERKAGELAAPEPAPVLLETKGPAPVPEANPEPAPPSPNPTKAAPRPTTPVVSKPKETVSAPTLTPDPTPVSASTSAIFINAIPPARLYVDGSDKGLTGWSGRMAVGSHQIRLVRDGQPVVERMIEVHPDREFRFCWDFKEGAPCVRR